MRRMWLVIMFASRSCSWEISQMLRLDKKTWSCIHALVGLFFYVLSYMLTTVMENQFYLDKACSANFGYNKTVCDSLTKSNFSMDEVNIQKYVATFTVYNNLVRQVLPILPGYLMGMWSDRYGARGPIIIGMLGKTVYFMGYVLNAYYFSTWPLEEVILTAALPRAIAGYDVGIFMAVRSHISEATPPELLTQRLAALEMSSQISAPLGLTIGSAIFIASGKNYIVSFLVSMAVAAFGLLYAALLVKNFPREKSEQHVNEDTPITKNIQNVCNIKSLLSNRTVYILLSMIFLQSMMYDAPLQFLYTQFKFRWDTQTFSNFQTTEALCSIVVSGVIVPLMAKLHVSDLSVLIGGVCMIITSRLCYGITNDERIMYLGAFASSFQSLSYINIYSMVSKNTSIHNRGKLLAIFTSMESATSLISSPVYSCIYSATLLTQPSMIFFISSLFQLIILFLALFLKYISRNDAT